MVWCGVVWRAGEGERGIGGNGVVGRVPTRHKAKLVTQERNELDDEE